MASDIRLFKLVTGEVVIGEYDASTDTVSAVCSVQRANTKDGGMQLIMVPYGVPFETTLGGAIEGKNILYRYMETPQELQDKYTEIIENIKKAGSIGKLEFTKPVSN